MPGGKPGFQYLAVNEVDGVAVITFLEAGVMVEGDRLDQLAKELFGLIESQEVQEDLCSTSTTPATCPARCWPNWSAAPQDAGGQGESPAVLPAPAGHGRLQDQPV